MIMDMLPVAMFSRIAVPFGLSDGTVRKATPAPVTSAMPSARMDAPRVMVRVTASAPRLITLTVPSFSFVTNAVPEAASIARPSGPCPTARVF